MYFFARHVLGVTGMDPLDGRIEVRPLYCPPLEKVQGTVMTPRGAVHVKVDWTGGKPIIETEGANVKIVQP